MFKCYLLCGCLLLFGCQTTEFHTITPDSDWQQYNKLMIEMGARPDNSNNPKWTYCEDKQDGYDAQRDEEFIKYVNENTMMKFLGCVNGHAQFTVL